MYDGSGMWKMVMSRPVINFVMALLGLTAAYYTTIGSIRLKLAEKAESVLVETIDKKISKLEVLIKEGVVSKDQFFEFRNSIDTRLSRIEFYLIDKRGDDSEG